MDILFPLLGFFALLFGSAFFSGTETAYFHLKLHREDIPEDVKLLLKNPRKLLVALLTGNTIMNVAMASLAALFTVNIAGKYGWSQSLLLLVEVVVVSVVVLIFGEIMPKILAIRKTVEFAKSVSMPVKILVTFIHPVAFIFYGITDILIKMLPFKREKIFDSEEELKILTEISEEHGTLQAEESEMIQSIFEFGDKTVHEIMTPRVDMAAMPSQASVDDIMDIIRDRQFSKIPIFKGTIDDIKGILYAKDLIPYLSGSRPNVNLASLSREPYFVPETKKLDDLLKEFKARKTTVAIVVDEWGGTSGLITLEDVVEEVLGEIRDPYDKEDSSLKSLEDGSYIADGRISIYDLEEESDIEFPEDRDYDTLGGFILEAMGNIPNNGETTEYQKWKFTVKKLVNNRIEKVHITLKDPNRDVKKETD